MQHSAADMFYCWEAACCSVLTDLHNTVWLGGEVVRALDLQLETAGSIPATDKLFTHNSSVVKQYDLVPE